MGYTSFTIEKIQGLIDGYHPKTVIDLGAQNNYSQPQLPAPYMDEWYAGKGIDYVSIDINGENGSMAIDLSLPLVWHEVGKFWVQGSSSYRFDIADMLVDAGTSEHVGKNGAFDWEAIYNCWCTKFDLLKQGGIMYSENPMTGNWPGHGFQYYTKFFYLELEKLLDIKILDLGQHPAMGNTTDGWNVYCTFQKGNDEFIPFGVFNELPLMQY
jgi:hypothetical protein